MNSINTRATADGLLTLPEQVATELAAQILGGRLQAGERIIEAEIAKRLGVSHSPVREALRQLSKAGLIEIAPRRGARVCPQDASAVRGLSQLLSALVAVCVYRALAASEDHKLVFEELSEASRGLAAAARRGTTGAHDAHSAIENAVANLCAMSRSPILAQVMSQRLTRFRYLSIGLIGRREITDMARAWSVSAANVRSGLLPGPTSTPLATISVRADAAFRPVPASTAGMAAEVRASPLFDYPEIQRHLEDVDAFVLGGGSEYPTLTEQVASRIRDLIQEGFYKAGDRLIESDLADRFVTSRGPVREAMRILDEQGLIEVRARRGAVVRQLTPPMIDELFDVRDSVAVMICRDAAASGHTSQSWRALFSRGVGLMDRVADHDQLRPIVWIELRRSLAKLVYAIAGNEDASRLATEIENRVATHYLNQADASARQAAAKGWCHVGQALIAGDGEEAAQAMHDMVSHSRRRAIASATTIDTDE